MTGILCINKPENITSFGVCAKVRKITGEKKCGHVGTLDPMATGVLPVLLGGATRFLDFLPESDKGYRAEFVLGKTTDTLDISGKVLSKSDVNIEESRVKAAADSFKGAIMQIPPMYSAVSVSGQRLYDLARQGIEVERKARSVNIKKISVCKLKNGVDEYSLDVLCSKGTYIRSLIDDIGKKLGCGAVMTKLRRTFACGFYDENCISLEELENLSLRKKEFDNFIIPVEKALSGYPSVNVSSAQSVRFKNGGALDLNRIRQGLIQNKMYLVYSESNDFLGIGEVCEKELKVKKVFVNK
ncbi:MAG: tRNA pseudouridine(55) synthase TruB [Clostridiales bacterium]|nr:tRNA pseudouridine(55) synthase TruB [Clostridiales bacterium]